MCGPVRDGPEGRVQKIIAAGGDVTDIVEVYDISLNTWETGVYDNEDTSMGILERIIHK